MKTWIIALTIAASILTAQAGVIYSTDLTTYSTGVLNGQDNWSTSGVATTNGIGAILDGFESAVNTTSSSASVVGSGQTYTSSVTFTFDDVSSGGANGAVMGAALFSSADPASTPIIGTLHKFQSIYRFQLRSNPAGTVNTSIGFAQSGTFTPESLGITFGSDQASDLLTLSLALTAGANANSWDATVSLFNETTASQVFQWTATSGNLVFADLGTTLYGGFTAGQSDSVAQVANRTGTAYSFESTIPEPATIGLLGAGALLTLLARRFARS